MSIADKVTALQNIKNGIRAAFVNKKVVLANDAGFDTFKTVLEDNAMGGINLRRFYAVQKNSANAGCSTSQITFACPFQPALIMFSYNSGNDTGGFESQQVTSGHLGSNAAVYIYKNGSSMGKAEIGVSGVANCWNYTNGVVTINKYSNFPFATGRNYWFYCIG